MTTAEQLVQITPEILKEHGLTQEEYDRIKGFLKRDPTITELGIYSVMWSEHCSYKNSRPLLKLFPTSGDRLLVKAGEENAGVVDIGNGWAISFKVESHNHPSAIEPFQGAATGVGGILRDIFTMGARPLVLMDSLRFGSLDKKQVKGLLTGVVSGIAHYGNCFGVPTVGGELFFDESYEANPLVNVFCLGLVSHKRVMRGAAGGVGNPVFYVGATTGRDGIHGATFASEDLTEESEKKRPNVQIGDPFLEKLLMEACLELYEIDALIGIQDMGAAGLTCSTCETAARGGAGIEIDVDLVPRRETGMTPYEVMLSESQERMLFIAKQGREKEVEAIFKKWDLEVAQIGVVTDDGFVRVKDKGVVVAEVPAKSLTDDAPIYQREEKEPENLKELQAFDFNTLEEPKDLSASLKKVLGNLNISSKRWVYQQYDHMVRTNTVLLPGSDAAVIYLKEPKKYVAMSMDGNSRYSGLNPYRGGLIAVAESARNVVCSGGLPLAVTDNLNFGNPYRPEVFWQMKQAVIGLAEACRFFNTPVVGGNVSLYNENPKGPIDPTPVVGMVGLIDEKEWITTSWFQNEGDVVIALGENKEELGGSEYVKEIYGKKVGNAPEIDLAFEKKIQDFTLEVIHQGWVASAHDCADGGLVVTAAESCFVPNKNFGVSLDLAAPKTRLDALLFGESQSRIVLSASPEKAEKILKAAQEKGVPAEKIGTVTSKTFEIKVDGKSIIQEDVAELFELWSHSLEKKLK